MKEIEAKIIEINPEEIITKLEDLGAVFEFTLPFKAAYFDFPGMPLKAKGDVLRLRQEGEKVVLTHKCLLPDAPAGIKVREEREVEVNDHAAMWKILEGLGYQPTLVMNKMRTQYHLGHVHVVVDQYEDAFAHIPAFMEIEAPTVEELQAVAVKLGFEAADLKSWSAAELIQYYAG